MSIFKSHITAMSAYKPPLDGRDAHQHLLLDFNERTLPVTQAVEDALVDYIRSGRLQMYPSYGDVVAQIASYAG
ncbi:MAG: histidinol-phosphate aminotransferase family protein, partial [Moraxellaceae bacterium]